MDRRAVLGLSAGLAGIVVGLTGAIAGVAALGAVAGVAAAVAAATTWWVAADRAPRRDRAAGRGADLTGAPSARTATDELVVGDLSVWPLEHQRPPPAGADLLMDPETGLFSEGYFRVALDARVSAARRHLRPVAVVILDVVADLVTGAPQPADACLVGNGIKTTVRDADTACRLADGRYALVLEDTPENGAIWTVERVRRRLVLEHPELTLWAGVACYPAHAFTPEAVLDQAESALEAAREWRQDRIEVALAP